MKYLKLKFLLLLFAIAAAMPPAWAETTYQKVTKTSDITSGEYLIVCESKFKAFNGAKEGAALNYQGHLDIRISSTSTITSSTQSSTVDIDAATFTIDVTNGTLKSKSGYYIGRNNNSNGMDISNETAYVNTFAIDDNGNAIITGGNGSGAILRYNSANNNDLFRYYKTTTTNMTAIQLYKKVGGEEPVVEDVATPTFSVETGTYTTAQTVEITCETQGATIHYTTDGNDPTTESAVYTEALTISTTTTLKAIAVKDGMNNSAVATATYTFPTIVTNLAQANALADGTNFVYNGYAVVTHVVDNTTYSNADVWLRDDQGNAAYLYRATPTGFANGDVLQTGWTATKASYKGLDELTNVTMVKTGTAEAKPVVLETITDADVSKYVRLENVTEVTGWYDKWNTGLTLEAGKTYNVEGIVGYYSGLQFWPLKVEDITPKVLTVKLESETMTATMGETIPVTVTVENAEGDYIVTYKFGENGTETTLTGDVINVTSETAGTVELIVNVLDDNLSEATATETYTFTEPVQPGSNVFKKVESLTELELGKKYIFVHQIEGKKDPSAMGDIPEGSSFADPVAVTINNNMVEIDPTQVLVYTLGGQSSAWTFEHDGKYLSGIASGNTGGTGLKFIDALTNTDECKWAIGNDNGTLDGYRAKNARYSRGIRRSTNNERYGDYSTTDSNSEWAWIYVQTTGETPTPEPVDAGLAYEVTEFSVEANGDFTAPTLINPNEVAPVTYSSSNEDVAVVDENTGEVVIGDAGTAVISAIFAGNDDFLADTASYTITVKARPELVVEPETLTLTAYTDETVTATFDVLGSDLQDEVTLTLADENGVYTLDAESISIAKAQEGATITVTYAPNAAGTHAATITVASKDAQSKTVALQGTATVRPVVEAPVFSLVSGSYGEAQSVTITGAPGATIYYTTDGSEPTTGSTVYTSAIELGEGTTTIKAIAVQEGMTNSAVAYAYYIIDLPETLPTITPFKGYYKMLNNGNNKYANIAGRKTMNFTSTPDKMAGTVIWLETNDKGQVQSLRSQGADLQGYANRAMRYVPDMVKMVVDKLHAEGAGEGILGENGYQEIMDKFDECFDYHLYVEQAQGGWRLYGKTPSMQPVVDFYREHTHQVEAKLPMLEGFINDALTKLRNKIGGQSIFTPFSVHQIWHDMDSVLVNAQLTEPVDSASTMAFYREVLNDKNYVWSFAFQTAQIYWNNVKNHPRYDDLKDKLGEYADYLDEFVNQIRPDFKYYVIQRGDEPDYISEGNKEIINNDPKTIWTLTPREDFTVTMTTDNLAGCQTDPKYATTLYTDFAYTLPEGIKAYKVKDVSRYGNIVTEVINGVIPAQTPVLLMADNAGDYVLTLSTAAGTKVTGNLLCGVDSLITRFELKTPIVVDLFSYAAGILGNLYDQYVADYEYLQLLYAGTVNNKYFWGITKDDVKKCVYINDEGDEDCVIRNLANGKFTNNWKSPEANKAFLLSETFNAIGLYQKGDVNHDGTIDVVDVNMTINRVLGKSNGDSYFCPICADVNNDDLIDVDDVTMIINISLGK